MGAAVLLFAKAYWKPLAIIAAVVGLFAYHRASVAWAHHSGVVDGRAEVQVQLDAANARNDALQRDLGTLREQTKAQNDALDALGIASVKAQARSDKAFAESEAKAKLWQGEATKLMAILDRPKSTDGGVCARADAVLRDLIGDSVQ